jgi:hypothetical protein
MESFFYPDLYISRGYGVQFQNVLGYYSYFYMIIIEHEFLNPNQIRLIIVALYFYMIIIRHMFL